MKDIFIHWGVYRNLRGDVGARGGVMLTAIALDVVILGGFAALRLQNDPSIVGIAVVGMAAVFAFEWALLKRNPPPAGHHVM